MPPTISIALPARNAEKTLQVAVESLLDQYLPPDEIVLVDHKSVDATYSVMKRVAKSDSRIRVFRCNGTFVEAANLAWQESKGEVIARMDSDDIARPGRLDAQIQYLESNPNLAACGTKVQILKRNEEMDTLPPDDGYQRYEKWVNSVTHPKQIEQERFVDSPIPNPTAMIHREVLEDLGGYHDTEWAEDYDFWLRMIETGYRIGKVDQVLLDWFDGDNRATRTQDRYSLTLFQKAKAHFLSRIPAVLEKRIIICGAGPIGKEFASYSSQNGVQIHAFCEVNRRQVGNRINGIPVIASDNMTQFRGRSVAIGAVGLPGGRARVRRFAEEAGFSEGFDFFSVA
ncbi:MAG: hypothetical protein CMO55_20320 [Verrucomicrobiales bacterium]|nr:hypothetical protein [Verrucomicrobiales bacterium]